MAELPFQAHANYGTWSIDFDLTDKFTTNLQVLGKVSLSKLHQLK